LSSSANRAGGALAGDLEPRDVVADLDRQCELGVGFALAVLEVEGSVAERQALEVERTHGTGLGAAAGRAQNFDAERTGGVVGAGERARARKPALDHGDRPVLDEPAERGDELIAAAEIDAVGEPDQLDVGGGGQEPPEHCKRVGALDGVGLGLDLIEPYARRGRRLEGNVAGRLRQRDERDAAIVSFRPRDQILGRAHADVPGAGGGKTVIDEQRKRRLGTGGRDRRIP